MLHVLAEPTAEPPAGVCPSVATVHDSPTRCKGRRHFRPPQIRIQLQLVIEGFTRAYGRYMRVPLVNCGNRSTTQPVAICHTIINFSCRRCTIDVTYFPRPMRIPTSRLLFTLHPRLQFVSIFFSSAEPRSFVICNLLSLHPIHYLRSRANRHSSLWFKTRPHTA